MIHFRAFGVRFTLPLLTLAAPLLALRLGLRGPVRALIPSLCAHELAHLLAARLAGVQISEIRLMPFGGSARMENPYRLSCGQIALVAAAGPAGNLLLMLLSAALAQWGLVSPAVAAALLRANLMLMFFNLIPALPLDGGRMLYALLSRPLGEARALRVGLCMGRLLAAALLAAMLAAALRRGKWNLTLLLAAAFILASERDERRALRASRALRLEEALDADSSPRPARIYQLDESASAAQALSLLRPRERAWFVLTRCGAPCGLIDGRSIVRHIVERNAPETALGELCGFRLSPASRSGAPKQK